MSEQGKINAHEEMEICTACCMRQSKKDAINLERYSQKIKELRGFLTTAETAATEYAQQATELQEEVERLRSLWIEYRNATDAGSNYSVLAELFKRFDDAIRDTE